MEVLGGERAAGSDGSHSVERGCFEHGEVSCILVADQGDGLSAPEGVELISKPDSRGN